MNPEAVQHCTFSARLDCRYLLHVPEPMPECPILIAALHGFGQSPEEMLPLTTNLAGRRHIVAALQAPNQFYLSQQRNKVGYCWATHKHSDSCVRLHHEMLLHVLGETGRKFDIPCERRILLGFSQPVGMNYRFAATHPSAIRGVIGICGGVPKNWEDGPYQRVTASLLHLARQEDEFYPPEVTADFAERLLLRATDVEFHMLEGGHRMPSKAQHIVQRWLDRIIPQCSSRRLR